MTDTPLRPRWFKEPFRIFAATVFMGLLVAVLHDAFHFGSPVIADAAKGAAAIGALAFISVVWLGMLLGHMRLLDGLLYTAAYMLANCLELMTQ
jgi:hypothetical protein